MEVAGLVLGGIPLAVHALQEYKLFLSNYRHAPRHLDSIIRHLQAQRNILENTCNVLLTGIVPPFEIDEMIQKPFNSSWNEHEGRIKSRLGQDFKIFQDTTLEMQNVVKSLHKKLDIDADGKPALRNDTSLIVALKERVRFALLKKDYDSLIAALNHENAILLTLVSQSKELEPFRKSRARHSYIRTIQKTTKGVYTSLCASVNCKCTAIHGIALELDSRKAGLMDMNSEGRANKSTFGVAFGSNWAKTTERWEQLQAYATSMTSDPPSVPLSLVPQGFHLATSGGSVGLSLTNASPASANSPLASTTSTMTSSGANFTRPGVRPASANIHSSRIEDLCSVFAGKNKTLAGGCFGFITDNTSQFFLSHKNVNSSACSAVSLRQIISGNHPRFPRLDYTQKVRIAYTLSLSLLPLVTTPWLEKVLSIDDITFLGEEDLGAYAYHLDRPFLARGLAISPRTLGVSCGHQSSGSIPPRAFTILSLALVLVQIMLGSGMEEHKVAEKSCIGCLLHQQAVMSQRAGTVLVKGGDMYADAVNWCLGSFMSKARQDDETFSQQYYDTVVAKLEGIVDIVGPLPS